MLDRNLQHLCFVEVLYWCPIDGVVLTAGCGIVKSGEPHKQPIARTMERMPPNMATSRPPRSARVPHSAEYVRPRRG